MVQARARRDGGMLSGVAGDQRVMRESIDTGAGDKRLGLTGNRAAHISRGTFVNKQADLGLNTTEEAAKNIRAEEAEYKSGMKKWNSQLSSAETQYAAAMAQLEAAQKQVSGTKIPSSTEALNKAYAQGEKSMVPVRFVHGGEVIRTVMMPKEAAEQYGGNKGVWATYVDNGKYFNVAAKERHHTQQMAHDAAVAAEQGKAKWMADNAAKAASQVNQAKAQLSASQGMLNTKFAEAGTAGLQIGGSRAQYNATKTQHAEQWKAVQGDQTKRIEAMRSVLSKFSVGKKEEGS